MIKDDRLPSARSDVEDLIAAFEPVGFRMTDARAGPVGRRAFMDCQGCSGLRRYAPRLSADEGIPLRVLDGFHREVDVELWPGGDSLGGSDTLSLEVAFVIVRPMICEGRSIVKAVPMPTVPHSLEVHRVAMTPPCMTVSQALGSLVGRAC